MPTFEIICLANSKKRGGRCIAGFKTDGSGWLRLVSHKSNGALYPEHYQLFNQENPQLFDILRVECLKHNPQPHQPENWIVTSKKWSKIGYPTRNQLNILLKDEIVNATNCAEIFGNVTDRVEWDYLQLNPVGYSLCLIKPGEILWQIITYKRRTFRAIFQLQDVEYNLGITDPDWQELLEQLPDGEYSSEDLIEFFSLKDYHPQKFMLTISLSEPFAPTMMGDGYCFKLVAAVINAEKVRTWLDGINN